MGKTLIIAAIAFLISQGSEWYVVTYLDLLNRLAIDTPVPFLNFRMGWNYGVNFGLFANSAEVMRWVLLGLALVITAVIFWYSRKFQGWLAAVFLGSLAGGALSNALERVVHGAVADFLNVSCCGINNPFAFNTADVFIFFGAFGLVIFSEKLKKRA
jgi:signal peptidase II